MLRKNDIESLAGVRFDDAAALFAAKRYSAAYYLAGYAVELGIKACIARLFQKNVIPDKSLVNATYSHNLDDLIGVAGLRAELKDAMSKDPDLQVKWGLASKWNETSRYAIHDQFEAASMLDAVGNKDNGVLQWLKNHW